MQTSSRLLFRIAIVLLGMLLAVSVFVAVSGSQKASALDSNQWETVQRYVEDYFGGPQFDPGRDGEAGLIYNKLTLAAALNNNGESGLDLSHYLGEGDDMANRPVLIDNLMTQNNIIPGTEFRCTWNVDQSCFSESSTAMVRELVDAHKAAGFSTDVVDYCVSSHTASHTTGGFGIIAQTGALSSDGDVPNVYELEWSRNGWANNVPAALVASNPIAAPEASAGFSLPATPTPPPNCESENTDAGLVRCQANWAIVSTLGNVGTSQTSMATVSYAGQTVDVRTGTVLTLSTPGTNLQVPINTLFSTVGLTNLDPLKTTIVASRTQHGGQAAIGLKMLGYNMVAGGYINSGISRWNSTQGEQQAAIGDALPRETVSPLTAPAKVDTTGPSVTSVAAENVTQTSADIHRIAGEPATLKIEYGTSPGVYTNTVNNTMLNADKTVSLSGLTAGTTYYYKATSYDGYANGTVNEDGGAFPLIFTTGPYEPSCAKPGLSLGMHIAYWASYADYTSRILSVEYSIANTGADDAYGVQIVGTVNTWGVSSINTPVAVGDIAAATGAPSTIKYDVPVGASVFSTKVYTTANDDCGNSYSYPGPYPG